MSEWEVFTRVWMMNQWLVQTIITDDGDWITARKHSNIVFFIILRPWLSDFSYCITQQGARLLVEGVEGVRLQSVVEEMVEVGILTFITWWDPFEWVDNWCVKTELKHWVPVPPPPPTSMLTGRPDWPAVVRFQLNKSSIVQHKYCQ